MKNAPRHIDDILRTRKIIVTCGTGGVGKTTLSAALAMRAALLGKRSIVITIDPAKRLATSLGFDELSHRPTDLTSHLRDAVAKTGRRDGKLGTFAAVIPDTTSNMQEFLKDLAASQEMIDRIMNNLIFQIFTKEFSGANEYMALERLQALDRKGEYDCIILDTPPSRNALSFLDAPKVLTEFFEERFIRWLILPANKIVSAGMKKALSLLERLTGAGFMSNLFDFAEILFQMQSQFLENMRNTTKLLESEQVGFVMVATPTPESSGEAEHFIRTLRNHKFNFDGVALNRTLGYLEESPAASGAGLEKALAVIEALQAKERVTMARLAKTTVPICAKVPELARDVHSVEDLLYVAMALDPPGSS